LVCLDIQGKEEKSGKVNRGPVAFRPVITVMEIHQVQVNHPNVVVANVMFSVDDIPDFVVNGQGYSSSKCSNSFGNISWQIKDTSQETKHFG